MEKTGMTKNTRSLRSDMQQETRFNMCIDKTSFRKNSQPGARQRTTYS